MIVRGAVLIAPMAPSLAIPVVQVVVVGSIVVADTPCKPPIKEVHQRSMVAKFLELKPSMFTSNGRPEMVEQ